MIARLVIRTAIWLAVMAGLLFGTAGTLAWPQAWIYLAELGGSGLLVGLWLARHDPDLLAQRLSPPVQREQPVWDRILMSCFVLLFVGWMIVMALDARRFDLSHVPPWLQVVGAIAIPTSMSITWLVFRANSYAAPVVKVQRERGQAIVTSGPYRIVRHPMYGGAVLFIFGTPLLLGSWYGVAWAPLFVILIGVRAVFEEQTLAQVFPAYAEYRARVRYRMVPFVW